MLSSKLLHISHKTSGLPDLMSKTREKDLYFLAVESESFLNT